MPGGEQNAVSKALDVEASPSDQPLYNQPLLEAIAAVDKVHVDGRLPVISVRRALLTNKHGQYLIQQPDRAPAVMISHFTNEAEFTTVHEVGHFIDFHGLGTGAQSASRSGDILSGWRAAIKSSQAVQHLGSLWQSSTSMIKMRQSNGFMVEYPISQAYLKYLLLPEELWARSYSQFIAVRSGSPSLLHQLDRCRDRPLHAFYYESQWDDADFTAIMSETQSAFQKMGWMK